MKTEFLNTVKKYNMFSPGDKVIVGLSGGPDSMCLINLLYEYRNEFNIEIEAAHVNHCIRGVEADRDENFVRNFCSEKGIQLHVLKIDIPALAIKSRKSTELVARDVRYDFFESLSPDKIATAHTGSDVIETMLMNLSRGASLHGITSIPPVRDKIVRPLIFATRSEIESFCQENSIHYVTDSTNLGNDYTRNKFRHKVIPELKAINPEFEHSALRCVELLREDDKCLNDYAVKILNDNIVNDKCLEVDNLILLPENIINRVIALFISRYSDADYEMSHIKLIKEHLSEKFSVVLPGNIKISLDGKYLYFDDKIFCEVQQEIFLKNKIPGKVFFGGKEFSLFVSDSFTKIEHNKNICVLDYSKIGEDFVVRSRMPGDKILFAKRRCSKSLKKLFNELKISPEIRNSVAVFADNKGVIYIDGIGADASRLASATTSEFLIIKSE